MVANPLDANPAQPSRLQRVEWVAQRAGWGLFVGIVLAALLGLAGKGPLSEQTRESDDGQFDVTYNRYLRSGAPDRLQIHAHQSEDAASDLRIGLNAAFLDHVKILRIVPQPAREVAADDKCEFVFQLSNARNPTIVVDFEPDHWGSLQGRLTIGGEAIELDQFVYP
jgi:hypothetical protein